MGEGKESIETVNRYNMNKQQQSADGKKEQSHNNTMSLEVHEERKDSLSWKGRGDTVEGSQSEILWV